MSWRIGSLTESGRSGAVSLMCFSATETVESPAKGRSPASTS